MKHFMDACREYCPEMALFLRRETQKRIKAKIVDFVLAPLGIENGFERMRMIAEVESGCFYEGTMEGAGVPAKKCIEDFAKYISDRES